jgi:hypothetical protein
MSAPRRPALLPLLALACGLTALPGLRAALSFEPAELVLRPKPGETEIRGEFLVKNTGDAPVRITRVQSGCLCTVPETPVEAVAPGATVSLPVVYKPGNRQGRQESALQIESSDGGSHSVRLVAEVPVRVSFSPRLLHFRQGEREARPATLTYATDPATELLDATLSEGAFELTETPSLRDGALTLAIRYTGDAAATARATARIRTRDSAGAEHLDVLYLRHSP